MTDRPIIFSFPMVKALLAGTKTQARQMALRFNGNPSPWLCVKPGERLWVREAWSHNAPSLDDCRRGNAIVKPPTSSIRIPRWASRLTLTVTDVRVQRLHAITEAEAQAEGIEAKHGYVAAFRRTWNDIHGQFAWDKDPDIVALTFTVEKRNIDELAA